MENPAYITLARQTALQRQMDVVANNIANASTTGFKREGTLFAEAVEHLAAGGSISMSSDTATFTDLSPGAIGETGDPLNVAITGDGMLGVIRGGETLYTSDGRFAINPEGELVLLTGDRVLDAGGAPLQVPPDAGHIAIARDGTVSAGGLPLGQLGLYAANAARLERVGGGLFRTVEPAPAVDRPQFAQGFLEAANVDPVSELVQMIEIQRAYERGQAILQAEHDRISEVTEIAGKSV